MVNPQIGFSMWLDFVERDFLKTEFKKLLDNGIVNGATSNPAIFAAAIQDSPAYAAQKATLKGKAPKEIYEALAIEDIRTAARALRPLYDDGNDGYISIEVDPFLSRDTGGTIAEGKRLFEAIGEPNVMIKVPATEEGYEAMRSLLAEGISVNATLVFSPEQAKRCVAAMQEGMAASSQKTDGVISVFVSRFDRMLDAKLIEKGIAPALTGIYNAAAVYEDIESAKAPRIRTLFASTGVKGGDLPADYYIRELMAQHSVNTAPLKTIKAYLKDAPSPSKLPIDAEKIQAHFDTITKAGIDMSSVYAQLMREGLEAFEKAFASMLDTLKVV